MSLVSESSEDIETFEDLLQKLGPNIEKISQEHQENCCDGFNACCHRVKAALLNKNDVLGRLWDQ